MDTIARDLKYGARGLLQRPAFSIVVIMTE